jgi:hypothetical protein
MDLQATDLNVTPVKSLSPPDDYITKIVIHFVAYVITAVYGNIHAKFI